MKTYVATPENVKLLGRTYLRNDILWCAYSATGIEFVSKAEKVTVTLYGDDARDSGNNTARYTVIVDGRVRATEMLKEEMLELTLVDDPEERVHVIRLIKVSESAMSTMGIGKISVYGDEAEIVPTATKDVFVEFIGDSITCGYGVEDENPEHHFVTSTENATKAFAYRAAEKLGVDYSLVSFSGYGVLSGYTDSGKINEKELLPPFYEKLGFSYAKSGENGKQFRVEDISWDFSVRQPQVIVINLGTNDMSYTGADEKKQKKYQQKYVEFVKKVRKNNPKSYILCVLGMMGDMLYPALLNAITTYRIESGDVRIETMPIKPIDPATEGYVADYHPTTITHERASDQVKERIIQIVQREYGIVLGNNGLALTFDDGPNTTTTVKVLDELEREEVKGTFFLIGNNINEESAESVKRALSLGYEIENHSVSHPVMSEMSVEEFLSEIEETSARIKKITGAYPTFFRPPYIAVSDAMRENIPLTLICGHGCDDWDANVSANDRAKRVLSQIKEGQIILLHDMEGNDNTVKALEIIIDRARALGYRFVLLKELFEKSYLVPERGVLYSETIIMK